eukprot:TRINITY_DN66337_c4_g1_i1.p1 TRINITY_DN66337_c4_g1~~TRINITY_DN66337_c4_g1_i1.p1  ORF type:complete len:407 (-),score=43.75 TRINITY_DN66337_c4_g1_i1:419-1639(-)
MEHGPLPIKRVLQAYATPPGRLTDQQKAIHNIIRAKNHARKMAAKAQRQRRLKEGLALISGLPAAFWDPVALKLNTGALIAHINAQVITNQKLMVTKRMRDRTILAKYDAHQAAQQLSAYMSRFTMEWNTSSRVRRTLAELGHPIGLDAGIVDGRRRGTNLAVLVAAIKFRQAGVLRKYKNQAYNGQAIALRGLGVWSMKDFMRKNQQVINSGGVALIPQNTRADGTSSSASKKHLDPNAKQESYKDRAAADMATQYSIFQCDAELKKNWQALPLTRIEALRLGFVPGVVVLEKDDITPQLLYGTATSSGIQLASTVKEKAKEKKTFARSARPNAAIKDSLMQEVLRPSYLSQHEQAKIQIRKCELCCMAILLQEQRESAKKTTVHKEPPVKHIHPVIGTFVKHLV